MRGLRFAVLGLFGAGVVGAIAAESRGASFESSPEREWRIPAETTPAPEPMAGGRFTVEASIPNGATFGALMEERGLSGNELRAAALDLYDLSKIRPDRSFWLTYADGVSAPVAMAYAIDEDRTIWVERDGEVWTARLEVTEYTSEAGQRIFSVDHSLWEDGLAAGLRPDDLARIASIFEYELDFNTEIHKGATITLAVDVQTEVLPEGTPEGEVPREKVGTIHAARIESGGKVLTAARFESGGEVAYFHPDGTGMKRPFLRSPLEFSRVTSGFNPKRFHPILKIRRPHNGTDFGAPTGTPVRSVADGEVVFAGVSSGHGNFVKVRHEGGYETSYSHLSKIAVRKGQRIHQGDRVGAVGMTGLATGPHLHFQMWKGGKFVDAMGIDLPNTSSVAAADRGAFEAASAPWLGLLQDQALADRDTDGQ